LYCCIAAEIGTNVWYCCVAAEAGTVVLYCYIAAETKQAQLVWDCCFADETKQVQLVGTGVLQMKQTGTYGLVLLFCFTED